MPILFHNKRHFLIRFPIGAAIAAFIGFLPFIVGFGGGKLKGLISGIPCTNDTCPWMVVSYVTIITLPVGGVLLGIWLIIAFIDGLQFVKKLLD